MFGWWDTLSWLTAVPVLMQELASDINNRDVRSIISLLLLLSEAAVAKTTL